MAATKKAKTPKATKPAKGDKMSESEIESPKKTGKAGKTAKGGKAIKEEKPKKAATKAEKAPAKGKAGKAKAEKIVKTGKIVKTKRVSFMEDEPLAEILETAAVEEVIPPVKMEKIGDGPDLPAVEPIEKLDFPDLEEISEEEQRENEALGAIIEEHDYLDFEEEEEASSRHDSIDERYPLQSDESEEDDPYGQATKFLEDRKIREMQQDFFEKIGHIPDVDEISIDLSIQNFIKKMEAEVIFEPEETIIEEDEEDEEEEGESEGKGKELQPLAYPAEEPIPIEEIFTSEISLEYEFESSEEEEVDVVVEKKVSDENLFEALIKLEEKQVVVEVIDFELLDRLNQQRQLKEEVKVFIKELIDCVVDEAEYVDPKEVLRESVDKTKLFNELYSLMGDLSAERRVNMFILRKTVEYYRRQKNYRPITPESDEIVDEEKRRFHVALDELNELLGRETTTAEITWNKVDEIEKEESEAEEVLNVKLARLQTLIQRTFAKRNSDHLNNFVEKRIREMDAVRKELSEVRSKLIIRLHIMARLKEKMIALENIGPGLYLRDYEDIEHERYVLIKKIEERQDDLDRHRELFHSHTNILAHMRERETMLYHALRAQQDVLDELRLERQNLRAYIYELKKSRIRVQKEIREISFQCGLIDKPALCRDYDEALERCLEGREIVKHLKKNIFSLERRIIYYTKCLENKERKSSIYKSIGSKIVIE